MTSADTQLPVDDNLADHYAALSNDKSASEMERQAARRYVSAQRCLNFERDVDALLSANEALATFQKTENHDGVADSLRLAVQAYLLQDKRKDADRVVQEGLAIFMAKGVKRGIAKMLLSSVEVNCDKRGSKKRALAAEHAAEALEIFTELGDNRMMAATWLATVQIKLKQKNDRTTIGYRDGLTAAEEALRLFKVAKDRRGQASALHWVGVCRVLLGWTSDGVNAARESLKIYEGLQEPVQEARALEYLATWQMLDNRAKDALNTADQALSLYKELGVSPARLASGVGTVVQASIQAKEIRSAFRVAEWGVEHFAGEGNERLAADMKVLLSQVHVASAATEAEDIPQTALALSEQALTTMQTNGDKAGAARMTCELAAMNMRMDHYETAGQLAEEALACAELSELDDQANAYQTLVQSHMAREQFDKALAAAQRLQQLTQDAEEKRKEAVVLMTICNIHFCSGDLTKSAAAAAQARALHHAAREKAGEAGASQTMAEVYWGQGEHEPCIKAAERARALWKEVEEKDEELNSLITVAHNCNLLIGIKRVEEENSIKHASQGMFDFAHMGRKALVAAKEAVALSKKLGNVLLQGAAQIALAQCNIFDTKYKEALLAANEAVSLFGKCGDKRAEATAQVLVGEVCRMTGKSTEAQEAASQALELFKDLGDAEGERKAQKIIDQLAAPAPGSGGGMMMANTAVMGHQVDGMMSIEQYEEQLRLQSTNNAKALELAKKKIAEVTSAMVGGDDVESDMPLMELGITSMAAVRYRERIQDEFDGLSLPATLVFDYPTINDITDYVIDATSSKSVGKGAPALKGW